MRPFDENSRKAMMEFLIQIMEKNNLPNNDVAEKLSCRPHQISWIKNPTYWKVVPMKVWDKLQDWKTFEDNSSHATPEKSVITKEVKEIKIEKGIPIPTTIPKGSKFPFDKMEVWDSFAIPIVEITDKGKLIHNSSSVSTAAGHFCRTHKGYKFVVRTLREQEIIRCWRVE